MPEHPSVSVSYVVKGFLDEIYATVVVRLHHSDAFEQDELWRYAADFKTNAGKQLGIGNCSARTFPRSLARQWGQVQIIDI